MSMGSRKVNTEGIDEELLLASIERRTQDGTLRPAQEDPAAVPTGEDTAAPEPPPAQPVTRERAQREGGRRKRQDEDYNELFLRRNEIKTRQCVYISRDVQGKSLWAAMWIPCCASIWNSTRRESTNCTRNNVKI